MQYRDTLQKLGKISLLHRLYFNKAAANKNIYMGQLPIIQYIISHDGCTQKQVAEYFKVSAPSIATSIKRLIKSEYISKLPDESDNRLNRLHATQKAYQISEDMKKEFDAIDAMAFSDFTANESDELDRLLDKMLDSMNTDEFKNKNIHELCMQEKKLHKKKGIV